MFLVKLSKSEPEVTQGDVELLEVMTSTRLPEAFKSLFLAQNGGVSNKDWWGGDDEYDPIRVKQFKAIARSSAPDATETKYIGGCYLLMTKRQVIPVTILPFAIDDGGNFFCLDMVDGAVCFFATDTYDFDLTPSENHVNAYRRLADSFEDFLSGLKDESEVDL